MMTEKRSRWVRRTIFAAACAVVIAVFAAIADTIGATLEWNPNPAAANYNLLVQGFRAGQLNLKRPVPPGFAKLADPYDLVANSPYRHAPENLHDTSYYRGKLYLYFGAVPAVVLLWPWAAITGHYLFPRVAVTIFCALGFGATVGILLAARRRYFPRVGAGVFSAGALALGLAGGIPVLLQRPGLCELPISCGYAFAMLALAALWGALHDPARRSRWLAAASLCYGLAIGSRPSLLFGAVILLVPLAWAWREPGPDSPPGSPARRRLLLLSAAAIPLGLIGMALVIYNVRRFGNPFEFGQDYQLAGVSLGRAPTFSLRYLWFNFRVYFLQPASLHARFPFVGDIDLPAFPGGYTEPDNPLPYGLLANVPFTWLALAAPLACRGLGANLRGWLGAAALFCGLTALTLCLYWGACARYEAEFLPTLVLLAVFGVLGLERALADSPRARRAVRLGWGLLLTLSIAFNLCASLQNAGEQYFYHGELMTQLGRFPEATDDYQKSLWFEPEQSASHLGIITVLRNEGRTAESIPHYREMLRFRPQDPAVENDLAVALGQSDRFPEAIALLTDATRRYPNYYSAQLNLGLILAAVGRREEAMAHLRQALALKPDSVPARVSLERLRAAHQRP